MKRVLYHKAPVDRLEKICKRRFSNVDRVRFIRHEAYSCYICANREASRGSHKIICKCACSEAWRKRRESQAHLLSNCNAVVKNSDTFYDAVDWGWGESLKRREEEVRKKELEVCKKELMLRDREKAIRRCEDKQYRMERQLQQMERRLEKVEREEKARDRKRGRGK